MTSHRRQMDQEMRLHNTVSSIDDELLSAYHSLKYNPSNIQTHTPQKILLTMDSRDPI